VWIFGPCEGGRKSENGRKQRSNHMDIMKQIVNEYGTLMVAFS
jgi:hypothetical protein